MAEHRVDERAPHQRKPPPRSSQPLPPRPADAPQPHGFPLEPLDRFRTACAPYQKPRQLATFSYGPDRHMTMGDAEMKYYHPPDLSRDVCDLSAGFDTYITRDENVDEHIDALLDALIDVRRNSDTPELAKSQFVCYRGIMTKIMTTPYSRNEPWELRATQYRGTIFIEEHETDDKRKRKHGENDRHRLMSYWGYKFESYCTSPKPAHETTQQDIEATRNAPVNTNIQHCVVFRSKLGRNSIIMGADCIDGVKSRNPLDQFIELKTSKSILSDRDKFAFEKYKLIKFWAQSFLPATPRILVGFRTEQGKVASLHMLKTLEIPRLVRGKPNMWDATVCVNFADALLNFVRETIEATAGSQSAEPGVTWTIRFQYPFERVEIIHEGERNGFLTERFVANFSE